MFTLRKQKEAKIEQIRSAPELFRIVSRFKKLPGLTRNILIVIALILFVYYENIILLLKEKSEEQRIVLILMCVFVLALIIFTAYMMNKMRGNCLVVTQKGLCLEPFIAELWENIEQYKWQPYKGFNRVTLSRKGEGTSLMIIKDGLNQHLPFAQYGIFFTDEQIQITNTMFVQFEIKENQKVEF